MTTAKRTGQPHLITWTAAAIFACVTAAAASGCGSVGDSGPGTGTGGAAPTGSGGSVGSGGGPAGSGGSSNVDGGVDGGGSDLSTVTCPARDHFTLAIHIVLNVSWPDTIGANVGTGQLHVWNLAQLTASGTTLTSMTRPCGSTLPELTLKPLVGGGKTILEIPDSAWEAPDAPSFPAGGTIAGWNPGSALSTDPTNVLVGLTLADPNSAWPTSYTMVTAVDIDRDGAPGITGIPRSGGGYVQPPVATAILGLGAKADKIYLASRTAVALTGTVTSCTEQAGTVTVKFFDNHIVGCHVAGGDACTTAQVDFVDTNRTTFTVSGGTFTSKIIADDATCTTARAAMGAVR